VDGERLVMQPRPKPRYTLDELLAESDNSKPMTSKEWAWLDAPPMGREVL